MTISRGTVALSSAARLEASEGLKYFVPHDTNRHVMPCPLACLGRTTWPEPSRFPLMQQCRWRCCGATSATGRSSPTMPPANSDREEVPCSTGPLTDTGAGGSRSGKVVPCLADTGW
jgi:hypothetical protein